MDKLDSMIASLEASLNIQPGASPYPEEAKANATAEATLSAPPKTEKKKKTKKEKKPKAAPKGMAVPPPADLPVICQIEFKVGVITKCWPHEGADKLWCEEIGERIFCTERKALPHHLPRAEGRA